MKPTHAIVIGLAVALLWGGCNTDSQEVGAQANLSDVTKDQFDQWMTENRAQVSQQIFCFRL